MGIKSILKKRRNNRIENKAIELSKIGEPELVNELIEAREEVEEAMEIYDRLEYIYGYAEERKEKLIDRIQSLKEKRREILGIPLPHNYLKVAFYRAGITKKGREFKKLERNIRTYERTLNRMEKNGQRKWEEVLEAEKNLDKAEENLKTIENKIKEKYKENKVKNRENKKENERANEKEKQQSEYEEKEEQANEENTQDSKDKKENNFKEDINMKTYTDRNINVTYFEKAIESTGLNPDEMMLLLGILKINDINRKTNNNNTEELKNLANELRNQIKAGNLGEYEKSKNYFIKTGANVFKTMYEKEDKESGRGVSELLAAGIVKKYIEEEIKNQKENTYREEENDRAV